MTRTDPPDILVSTVYQDINVNLTSSGDSVDCRPFLPCDVFMSGSKDHNLPQFNKRHCRSFDFLESFDDQPNTVPLMEQPKRSLPRRPGTPEPSSQPVVKKVPLRSSATESFNSSHEARTVDPPKEQSRPEPKRRARSKSAPRIKSTFIPVQIPISSSPPPTVRRGREVHRAPREPPKAEASPKRESIYTPMKALVNEVHPIKLQPQRSNASRISPLCVSNSSTEENQASKPANTPHVRCRMDIKPDEAVIQHTSRTLKAVQNQMEAQYWQRLPGTPRSLTVPNRRHISVSRTPTPSDSYSVDHRTMHFQNNPASEYYSRDPRYGPYQNVPSPREFRDSPDCGSYGSPNVPTKFFYTEEQVGFSPTPPMKSAGYEGYPRPFPLHSVPSQAYYMEDPPKSHMQGHPPRGFYMEDPRPYPIQEAPSRTFYGEDPRFYPPRSAPPLGFYAEDPRAYPIQSASSRMFFAEDYGKYSERETFSRTYPYPRSPQPLHLSEWYFPDQGSLHYQHLPMSPFTPQSSSREAMLSSWHASYSMNQQRLGADTRSYSKSWDNILTPGARKEDPLLRGRSYENLLSRDRRALSPDDRRQPVVVNLSCSPKRYAALSLSENSIIEKMHSDGRYTMGRSWFVTPEITITDNDIKANGYSKNDKRSASWDALDSGQPQRMFHGPVSYPRDPTKETIENSASRQRSLEQLDELIADLVIDYKPPSSRRTSEAADALTEQLRKLISEEVVGNVGKPESQRVLTSLMQPKPMKEQPVSSFLSAELLKGHRKHSPEEPNSSLYKPTEECSPELSAEEDDVMMCSNAKCRRTETMFNACLYFKSCHSCYTFYCSRNCRREDWDTHKENCIYGRIGSICRHILKFCRENMEVHKAFSRIAKVGFLSRGRGVLFLGFPSPGSSKNFLQFGLEGLLMSPTFLSLRELESYSENLGDYGKELQESGAEYDPDECFLLNVTVAVGQAMPDRPSMKDQVPTIRKYAKIALASSSPEKKIAKKEKDMETLILTPPPGTTDIDKEGEEGRKAREVCFIHIQRELRIRGVFLRHEFPKIYKHLCEFVEDNKRFTPTTIYPIDKRTGKQFMCMIMAASEPRTLDWVASPNLLDDLM